jgi:hypothetical protein
MPSAAHHVSCVTYQNDAVMAFLHDVLGLQTLDRMLFPHDVTSRFLGWPDTNPGAVASMVGTGGKGLIEVVQAPEAVNEHVAPGTALITFAVPDLEARLDEARRRGFHSTPIHNFNVNDDLNVDMAIVAAGDLRFELIRYNTPTDPIDFPTGGSLR